jgi:hypothetical protein
MVERWLCAWGICGCGWERGFKPDPLPPVGFARVSSVSVRSWVKCGGASGLCGWGFVVVAGKVVSSTIHYLQSVLPWLRRVWSALGVGCVVVVRLACDDGGFVVVAGNVVSSSTHYLQSVLPGFRHFRSVLGVG